MSGYRFILIDAPCPTGWYSDPSLTPELGQLAVKTGYFPMYEIENGKLAFTKKFAKYRDPEKRVPIKEYLKLQGRFKGISPQQLEDLESDLQYEWDMLARLE
jgi:pyruvate ferredoxin oxidoreductase beta subunit